MSKLKSLSKLLLVILLNVGSINAAVVIYQVKVWPILIRTSRPMRAADTITYSLVLLGILIFLILPKSRKFCIALTALSISGITYLYFFLNMEFGNNGVFRTYPVNKITWTGSGSFLDIRPNAYVSYTPVDVEMSIDVDSAQIKVLKGFLGHSYFTNEVKILPTQNCDHSNVDSSNFARSHLQIGKALSHARCFDGAVVHFSQAIAYDSTLFDAHYGRGLVYLFEKEYQQAQIDFINALLAKELLHKKKKYRSKDKLLINSLDSLVLRIKQNDTGTMLLLLELAEYLENAENCIALIKYCDQKINPVRSH